MQYLQQNVPFDAVTRFAEMFRRSSLYEILLFGLIKIPGFVFATSKECKLEYIISGGIYSVTHLRNP